MLMKIAASWFKRIDVSIKSWYERFNSWFIGSILIKTTCAIIVALLIAYLTNIFSVIGQQKETERLQKEAVSTIQIGFNKEYIDSVLGQPVMFATNEHTGIDECIYSICDARVRAYYKNNTLRGYFLTLKSKEAIGQYWFEFYNQEYGLQNAIGEYCFDELLYEFYKFEGHFGADYQICPIYLETYYVPSTGIPIDAIFAVLPDGMFIPPQIPEYRPEHFDGKYRQWGGDYPNTWGIVDSHYSVEIGVMLFESCNTFQNGFYMQYDDERKKYMEKNGKELGYGYDFDYDALKNDKWQLTEFSKYYDYLENLE